MPFPRPRARQSVLEPDDVCRSGLPTKTHRLPRTEAERLFARRCLFADRRSLNTVDRSAVPTPADFRPRLFRLARSLKYDAGHPDAASAMPAFRVWYFLNLPHSPAGTTYPAAEREFLRGFEAARTGPLTWLARIARKTVCDWWEGAERRLTGFLGAVARVKRVLYLSCRVIEELAGVPKSTAARWLLKLASEGLIRVVAPGGRHHADRLAAIYDLSPLLAVGDAAARRREEQSRPKNPLATFIYGIDVQLQQTPDPADGPLEWVGGFLCPISEPDSPANAFRSSPGAGEDPGDTS